MRTGTTLLQAMLCSTEETNPLIHEAQYVTRLAALYPYALSSFDRFLCHYLEDPGEIKALHADMLRGFLDRTLERYSPARRLVLKNPDMTKFFVALFDLLPDSQFVVAVRDPRDTIASVRDVIARQMEQGLSTNLIRLGDNFERHAVHYNGYYNQLINNDLPDFQDRLAFHRYEDLVTDAGTAAQTLAAFTGLPLEGFDPDAPWRSLVDYGDTRLANDPFRAERRGKPFAADRIGRYRDDLPGDAVRTIERACAPMMERFGYPRHA